MTDLASSVLVILTEGEFLLNAYSVGRFFMEIICLYSYKAKGCVVVLIVAKLFQLLM